MPVSNNDKVQLLKNKTFLDNIKMYVLTVASDVVQTDSSYSEKAKIFASRVRQNSNSYSTNAAELIAASMHKNMPTYNTFDGVITAIENGSFDIDVIDIIKSHWEALANEQIPDSNEANTNV